MKNIIWSVITNSTNNKIKSNILIQFLLKPETDIKDKDKNFDTDDKDKKEQ